MFKYSSATYVLAAYFVFICGLFATCQVARADVTPSCEAWAQSQLTAVAKEGAKVGTKAAKTSDGGAVLMVQLVNPKQHEAYVFAFASSSAGAALLKESGMTPGPQCQEEGQVWSTFSIRLSESI